MASKRLTATISQVAELLSSKQRIALFAHTNPDGDTVGSCVALCLALRSLGHHVSVFCEMDLSDDLQTYAQGVEFSTTFSGKYDLMVAVDCADILRLGSFEGVYGKFNDTLTIDHHGGEYFSKYNCVLDYASNCQIVYELLGELNVKFDLPIATSLFLGVCTDTGNFMHSNTDSASFAMASELLKYGVDNEKISRIFFKQTSLAKTKLIARALSKMRTYYDERLIIAYITQADLNEFGVDFRATSGIVQYAINVDTAKIGVCMTESAPNTFKISMRGKEFDVRNICLEFGGGGHPYAAACRISGFLEDVIEKIVRVVGFYL